MLLLAVVDRDGHVDLRAASHTPRNGDTIIALVDARPEPLGRS